MHVVIEAPKELFATRNEKFEMPTAGYVPLDTTYQIFDRANLLTHYENNA